MDIRYIPNFCPTLTTSPLSHFVTHIGTLKVHHTFELENRNDCLIGCTQVVWAVYGSLAAAVYGGRLGAWGSVREGISQPGILCVYIYNYCIVLYLYIYIALLAVYTKQKCPVNCLGLNLRLTMHGRVLQVMLEKCHQLKKCHQLLQPHSYLMVWSFKFLR